MKSSADISNQIFTPARIFYFLKDFSEILNEKLGKYLGSFFVYPILYYLN